jgi:hypothetical protein
MSRYCPAGDGEYADEFEVCPECGRELTDAPPAQSDSDDIVWLVTAPNEPEAEMWAESIRAAGIPVFVRAGGPGVGAWASSASFEHELLIHDRNLLDARRILRDLTSGSGISVRARRTAPRINPARRR